MGDNLKGAQTFEVDGKVWTLVFTINSLIDLEEELDLGVAEIGASLAKGMRLRFLRSVFKGGLAEHHPDITDEEAGRLIGAMVTEHGPMGVSVMIANAFAAAFSKAGEEASGAASPRKRKAGTGKNSTASGLNSN